MSDAFTWAMLDADGAEKTDAGLSATTFPTQADAEAWMGEAWSQLADAGVAAVTLRNNDQDVYGPMPLTEM